MTTAMMVRDWENRCEQTECSDFEENRIYEASRNLDTAVAKISEALEWIAKAISEVNEAELTAAEDRITSLYDSLEELQGNISSESENL